MRGRGVCGQDWAGSNWPQGHGQAREGACCWAETGVLVDVPSVPSRLKEVQQLGQKRSLDRAYRRLMLGGPGVRVGADFG